jgi:hypothetical protein
MFRPHAHVPHLSRFENISISSWRRFESWIQSDCLRHKPRWGIRDVTTQARLICHAPSELSYQESGRQRSGIGVPESCVSHVHRAHRCLGTKLCQSTLSVHPRQPSELPVELDISNSSAHAGYLERYDLHLHYPSGVQAGMHHDPIQGYGKSRALPSTKRPVPKGHIDELDRYQGL